VDSPNNFYQSTRKTFTSTIYVSHSKIYRDLRFLVMKTGFRFYYINRMADISLSNGLILSHLKQVHGGVRVG